MRVIREGGQKEHSRLAPSEQSKKERKTTHDKISMLDVG